MRTIKFNGKNLDISASEERVLFTLYRHDFAAKKEEFTEKWVALGKGSYIKSTLPKDRDRRKKLGIREVYSPRTEWEKLFFKKNPQCRSGIFGNKRRINAILKSLDAEVERECMEELRWVRRQDLTIPYIGE
mgnify:CR=1 FL=1